jgi:hypothetical protein
METDIYYTYASKQELLDIGADPLTIYEDISESYENLDEEPNGLTQVELTKEQCAKLIPEGNYCYKTILVDEIGNQIIKPCPFWDKFMTFPKQNNGYCHLLKEGDWQGGLGLLWDQSKCCGVNEYKDDYEDD